MIASVVDWGSLAEAVYVSVAVGLGVLLVAGIAVASSLRAQDDRAAGATAASSALMGVTSVCVLALAGAIGAGIYLLTQ
jgi:hypothetical protein